MKLLRKLFRTLMEGKEKDVTNSQIAQEIGVCDATISNFLNYKNDLTFSAWLLAIRYLAPEKEGKLIETIAEEYISSENRLNCRLLMEYASTKKDFVLLNKLITSQSNAPKENKDWAEIYKICISFQQRKIDNEETLRLLDGYKAKTNETRVFCLILKAYILYMLKEYKMMFRTAKSVEKDVEQIKNPYIRESYTVRLCEIFAKGYLYLKNDVKKARFYANTVINSKFLCPKFTSHMYHLLGTSFVFENYEQSVKYFQLYCQSLEKQGRYEIARETEMTDLFFVKVLWGHKDDSTVTNDSLEMMHYYARIGYVEQFENLLKKVDNDDPFAMCYKGIATNDPELLIKSIAKFVENGNKFFAELPRKEIKDNPIFSLTANVICSMNIA